MKAAAFRKLLDRYADRETDEQQNTLVDHWYDSFNTHTSAPFKNRMGRRLVRNEMHTAIGRVIDERPMLILRLPVMLRIAASILLIAGVSWFAWRYGGKKTNHTKETFTYVLTGTTGLKQLKLSDSTIIWLNAGSKFHYGSNYGSAGKRQVFLDEGEAFFDVKHDEKRPFLVTAGKLHVQVLGTSFNIRSYKVLNAQKITVTTGKVAVSKEDHLLGLLTPGQQITLNANGKHDLTEVNALHCNAWISGKTYLSQVSFDELSLAYYHHFGIRLKGSSKVYDHHYSITFDNRTRVEDAVRAVCSINQLRYRKEANAIVLY